MRGSREGKSIEGGREREREREEPECRYLCGRALARVRDVGACFAFLLRAYP
jgi:hypothetical protein